MKVIELAQEELICTSVDETGLGTGYAPGHVKSRSFFDDED